MLFSKFLLTFYPKLSPIILINLVISFKLTSKYATMFLHRQKKLFF